MAPKKRKTNSFEKEIIESSDDEDSDFEAEDTEEEDDYEFDTEEEDDNYSVKQEEKLRKRVHTEKIKDRFPKELSIIL